MPDAPNLEKAVLQEIRWDPNNKALDEDKNGKSYPLRKVQFNPETLKVAFSNQLAGGDDSKGSAIQFSSKGTTKLTMDLLFDVTSPDRVRKDVTDVRRLTQDVAFFMQTQKKGSGDKKKFIPPGVRFQWGSFLFEGVMESINETLEFFSAEGKPLRATLSISLVKQDVDINFAKLDKKESEKSPVTATRPQQAARQNESVQQMAGRLGKPDDWQQMALANDIENPRRIPVGTLISE